MTAEFSGVDLLSENDVCPPKRVNAISWIVMP
jgi:hypothetical protein